MAKIVLVPGAYHGGWYYTPLIPALRDAGHDVFTISLTGLDGPVDRSRIAVNLDTHIEDVVSLVELEQLEDIVLCGHSYGGMVIAGAADRMPGRIKTLLFIDAIVPNSGDSVWSLWPTEVCEMFVAMAPDGVVTGPPPGVDRRARAHPLATFMQPITIGSNAYAVPNKVYALCAGDEGSPFWAFHERLSADPAWSTRKLTCGHDFMNQSPDQALQVILDAASLGQQSGQS
jgi:pimeloyl-ACP methyl ester carboxylesterase